MKNISYYDTSKTTLECIWEMGILFSSLSQIQDKTKQNKKETLFSQLTRVVQML